jgi:predicted ATPase
MLIKSIGLRNVPEGNTFPFNLELIQNLETIQFDSNITFFVGENGSGKSTLLEGLAAYLNLPVAGSEAIDSDPHLEGARYLGKYLSVQKTSGHPNGFLSRAEDFIGFVKNIQQQIQELTNEIKDIEETWTGGDMARAIAPIKSEKQELINRYGENLDAMSHGEGFLKFFLARITGKGIYLIDEPEAALSPQRQLSLISLIRQKVKEVDSQFIIATHSPIILSIPEAQILEFKDGKINQVKYTETELYQLTKQFLENPDVFLKEL